MGSSVRGRAPTRDVRNGSRRVASVQWPHHRAGRGGCRLFTRIRDQVGGSRKLDGPVEAAPPGGRGGLGLSPYFLFRLA